MSDCKGCDHFSFTLKIYLGAVACGELKVASGGTWPDFMVPLIKFLPTTNGARRLWSPCSASLNELSVIQKDLIRELMPFHFFEWKLQ